LSRNFELLFQAGRMQEILQTQSERPTVPSDQPQTAAVTAPRIVASTPCLEMEDRVRDEITKLVRTLFLFPDVKAPRRVVFAGTESGSGCTWVCAHAAEILASQIRASVCVVDCNLRSPRLHHQFGLENHRGLSDALHSSGAIRPYARQLSHSNLWLLSCGLSVENWQTLMASDRMRQRLAELRSAFDYVLIDATPLGVCNDAIFLGGLSDGVVLVLKENSSRRDKARQALKELQATNIPIFGAVLNQRTFPIPDRIYRLL
jgi:polysaccharide biosynthesis transport protein